MKALNTALISHPSGIKKYRFPATPQPENDRKPFQINLDYF
jgi:hypothetical protein